MATAKQTKDLKAACTQLRELMLDHVAKKAELTKIEKAITELRGKTLGTLLDSGMNTFTHDGVIISDKLEAKLTISSWPTLCSYIHKHRAYELLQKRLTIFAVNERLDAGETIPGVAKMPEHTLSVTVCGR